MPAITSPPGRVAVPALVAGLLVAASVPPWGFWVLAPPGLALLAWRLGGLGTRARLVAGLGFGLGLFGPTLWWTTEFHAVGYVGLVLLETSFLAGACALVPLRPEATLVGLPGALVLAELARGAVPFGGFPMAGIPLGQAGGPLAPAARLGGALVVTGLTVALGCALAGAVRRLWRPAAALAGVAVLLALAGLVSPDGGGRAR